MAEERLIDNDEDKDRKYRIRVNEDGEEELIIIADEKEAEAESEDSDGFEVPELDSDDEEAAVMTPEQLAERDRIRRAEREMREKLVSQYLDRVRECIEENDYDGAVNALDLAEQEDEKNEDVALMKFKLLSRDFTDFSLTDECLEAARNVREYCREEQRAELFSQAEPLAKLIAETRDEADSLAAENEKKREERRVAFNVRRMSALKKFIITCVPFIVFLALAIGFSTIMFSSQDGLYLIITIVFAVIAVGFFIATIVTLRKLWEAQHNIILNNKNSSTKLGRQSEEALRKYKSLCDIYDALGGK